MPSMTTASNGATLRWTADRIPGAVSSEDVLLGVAAVLEHFIARSEAAPTELKPTVFDGPAVMLDQSVIALLQHLISSGLCAKECFIMCLVYGERILQRHPDFRISRRNAHRFILATVLVGSKILDDFYCRNLYYARAGGLSKAEMNKLEMSLCFLLNFDLNVKLDEFALYRDSLVRNSASPISAVAAVVASRRDEPLVPRSGSMPPLMSASHATYVPQWSAFSGLAPVASDVSPLVPPAQNPTGMAWPHPTTQPAWQQQQQQLVMSPWRELLINPPSDAWLSATSGGKLPPAAAGVKLQQHCQYIDGPTENLAWLTSCN
jgi:hypothetical protein